MQNVLDRSPEDQNDLSRPNEKMNIASALVQQLQLSKVKHSEDGNVVDTHRSLQALVQSNNNHIVENNDNHMDEDRSSGYSQISTDQ